MQRDMILPFYSPLYSSQATILNRPHLGICLPSTCEASRVQEGLDKFMHAITERILDLEDDAQELPYEYVIGDRQYTKNDRQSMNVGDGFAL